MVVVACWGGQIEGKTAAPSQQSLRVRPTQGMDCLGISCSSPQSSPFHSVKPNKKDSGSRTATLLCRYDVGNGKATRFHLVIPIEGAWG